MSSEASSVTAWLDRFFAGYYDDRPVNATFIGVHDQDRRLPDLSENAVGDSRARAVGLLREAERFVPESLPAVERLDLRLAQGFLRTQLWEQDGRHFHRGNPSTYTGEAVFGVLSLFLTDFAPLAERVESATARLRGIGTLFEQARANVREAPLRWTERAIRECDGGLLFLEDGLPRLCAEHGIHAAALEAAAAAAASDFAAFKGHLEATLQGRTTDHYACGEEALALHLRQAHFLAAGADEIVRYAEAEGAEAEAYLKAHARDFGVASPEQALAQLTARPPSGTTCGSRHQERWNEARDFAQACDLLTWPDSPLRFRPQPAWVTSAAPHLYFLFYRSPASYGRPPVHDCLVTPPEADNDSVVRLNHVIHHAGIGHHVQNWHAARAASRIGRIAAVDCAARIAMLCGGTMAEGWACYATDLMGEAGFLTPLEQYSERHARLRMCVRAIVDVRLHQGRWTLEEAAGHYQQRALMAPGAALAEAVKNSMFPGGAVMYLMGRDAIHRLRRDMSGRLGDRFRRKDFHDGFLAHGSIPVSLISASMLDRGALAE